MKKWMLNCLVLIGSSMLITNMTFAQSEFAPISGSTFTYKVAVDDNTNTVNWAIKKDGTALTVLTDFSSSGDGYIITTEAAAAGEVGYAKATITWGPALAAGTYVLEFSEVSSSCTTFRTADVALTANTSFDLTAAASNATACNALHNLVSVLDASATTQISFTVDMAKAASWTIDSWKYMFTITPTYADASTPAPSIVDVTIGGTTKTATGGFYSDELIPQATTQRTILVNIAGNANKTINIAFAVSSGFAVNGVSTTAEGGSNTNAATTSITKLPSSSAILAN